MRYHYTITARAGGEVVLQEYEGHISWSFIDQTPLVFTSLEASEKFWQTESHKYKEQLIQLLRVSEDDIEIFILEVRVAAVRVLTLGEEHCAL